MALKRIGGGVYFYRSVRQGDRVRSEYVARGATARLLAEAHQMTSDLKEMQADQLEAARTSRARRDRELDAWCRAVDDVARLCLVASGFHQHHRGEWRKRRGQI